MYETIIKILIETGAIKATKFLSPKNIIRVTRIRYAGKFDRHSFDLRITNGRPNSREREYINLLKNAGEPFPVKKIKLNFMACKKKKK